MISGHKKSFQLYINEKRAFKEIDAFRPRTPYNASKAAANHVVMAYCHTFNLPVTISHCSNNFGPYQFPEKVISRFVTNLIDGEKIPLYKSSQNKREYIFVDDHNEAVDLILKKGKAGETYNIGSGVEKSIEEIADSLLAILGKPKTFKKYVPDRKGHDRCYLLSTEKISKELGWKPKYDFDIWLEKTVTWYQNNQWWWRPLKLGAEKLYDKTGQK